ncbi:MAG: CotH kinase family protein, partial [Crocinitomicaceae bacterium]|nr:CotH kinase family protein [Crocinitomicaceae bacterium]
MKLYHSYRLVFFFIYAVVSTVYGQISISPKGGNHYGLREVNIDYPSDYKAYYTLDGSTPNKRSTSVPGKIELGGNTVLRFLFIDKEGKQFEQTHSYIVEKKHTLPIVSIAGNPAYFFDSLEGMFEMGCCADTVSPYFGANFWKKKERAVNFEFFENAPKNKDANVNQIVGIKIFGGFSKAMPQKSLAIHARNKYGSNKLKYAFFPQLPFKKYKSLILRNGGNDMEGSHIRDVLATQLMKGTGLFYQEYRPVIVYINGKYWGKYNLREKINEHFIKAHTGYHKDSLVIMRHNADKQYGSPSDYRKFISKLANLDMTIKENVDYVASKMDIRNYFLYNIAQIYTGNGDAGGNIRYYKHVSDTAKWRWIFYDLDATFNINGNKEVLKNSLVDFTALKNEAWPNPPWSTLIIRKLLENDSLRYVYINDFCFYLSTIFEPKTTTAIFNDLISPLEPEIDFHLQRWGISRKKYNQHLSYISSFLLNRPKVILMHLQNRFDLPATSLITVNYQEEFGTVYINDKKVKSGFNGIFFQGIPFHCLAEPNFDYEFAGWGHSKEIIPEIYQMISSNQYTISPIFRERRKSPFAFKIRITEIDSYQDKNKHGDWIELFNRTEQPIDISNWILKDNNDKHSFTFPAPTIIAPKGFLIVAQDSAAFLKYFKNPQSDVIGSFGFGLEANKDKIRLYDAQLRKVDEVNLHKIVSKDLSDTLSISLKDIHLLKYDIDNWLVESTSAGKQGDFSKNHELESRKKQQRMLLLFYSGILSTILFLFFFSFFLSSFLSFFLF